MKKKSRRQGYYNVVQQRKAREEGRMMMGLEGIAESPKSRKKEGQRGAQPNEEFLCPIYARDLRSISRKCPAHKEGIILKKGSS